MHGDACSLSPRELSSQGGARACRSVLYEGKTGVRRSGALLGGQPVLHRAEPGPGLAPMGRGRRSRARDPGLSGAPRAALTGLTPGPLPSGELPPLPVGSLKGLHTSVPTQDLTHAHPRPQPPGAFGGRWGRTDRLLEV